MQSSFHLFLDLLFPGASGAGAERGPDRAGTGRSGAARLATSHSWLACWPGRLAGRAAPHQLGDHGSPAARPGLQRRPSASQLSAGFQWAFSGLPSGLSSGLSCGVFQWAFQRAFQRGFRWLSAGFQIAFQMAFQMAFQRAFCGLFSGLSSGLSAGFPAGFSAGFPARFSVGFPAGFPASFTARITIPPSSRLSLCATRTIRGHIRSHLVNIPFKQSCNFRLTWAVGSEVPGSPPAPVS